LGSGGHSKTLIEILNNKKVEILGVSVSNNDQENFSKHKIFTDEEVMNHYKPENILLINGVGSLPNDKKRYDLFKKFSDKGYKFSSLFHPSSVISSDVNISDGAQVLAGTFIGPGSSIGIGAIINTHTSIDHDCKIGNHSHVSPGVTCSGNISIGSFTHISTGASIINNIKIGNNVVIYPGMTVVKDVPDNVILKPLEKI